MTDPTMTVAEVIATLQEVRAWHRDPESREYNECENEECVWCESAAEAAACVRAAFAELAELRTLRARVEAAPVGELVEVGDDDTGQPRALIHATRDELRKFGASLFGRVRLVVEEGQ